MAGHRAAAAAAVAVAAAAAAATGQRPTSTQEEAAERSPRRRQARPIPRAARRLGHKCTAHRVHQRNVPARRHASQSRLFVRWTFV